MPDPLQTLRDADALIRQCQEALAKWSEPGQMSNSDALAELLGVLDGPEQRRVQAEIGKLVKEAELDG